MKRQGYLFDKICTLENFILALKNAVKGKKHYKEVLQIKEYGAGKFIQELLEEVKTHKYKTSEYHVFTMLSGGKLREIYKLPMKDRIVQHAIMNIIEPIFRKSFIRDTYASIKERGLHKCAHRIQRVIKSSYCLKIDVKKFYPSIDLTILKQMMRRKFKDPELLNLLDEIISSANKGVPIGNYTSLYFANYFLTPFDHFVKEDLQIKDYFRYCDDIVIFHENKDYLFEILKIIKLKLTDLNLRIKHLIFPTDLGVDFIGFVFYPTHTRIRKRIKKNFIKNRLKSASSYYGMLKHANCKHLIKKYVELDTRKL